MCIEFSETIWQSFRNLALTSPNLDIPINHLNGGELYLLANVGNEYNPKFPVGANN